MTRKPHLVLSADPLTNRAGMVTFCGLNLAQVRIVFMWDEMEAPAALDLAELLATKTCSKCFRKYMQVQNQGGYLYGVRDAKEQAEERWTA